MRLGFLGTGMITDAVVRGIFASDANVEKIFVSPRNTQIAHKLAADFSSIKIAKSNQEVVDCSDTIFVALRAQIAEETIKSLIFCKEKKLVTFMPTITCAMLSGWINHIAPILRAMPLPFIAEHKSVTPIFPVDQDLQEIFSRTGGVIEVKNEQQFNLFMTAGSIMGLYFRFVGICNDWMQEQGLDSDQTTLYLAQLFSGLAEEAVKQKTIDFKILQKKFSTIGGTNELMTRLFEEKRGTDVINGVLNEALSFIVKT